MHCASWMDAHDPTLGNNLAAIQEVHNIVSIKVWHTNCKTNIQTSLTTDIKKQTSIALSRLLARYNAFEIFENDRSKEYGTS